jgi:hypothetical protein
MNEGSDMNEADTKNSKSWSVLLRALLSAYIGVPVAPNDELDALGKAAVDSITTKWQGRVVAGRSETRQTLIDR